MTKSNLIFGLDDFIREKSVFEKLLLVTLADGSLLYQDDGRFGPEDKFWVRLKANVEGGLVAPIYSIDLYYREQCQIGLSDSDIFFYTRRAIAEMGSPTVNQILIGRRDFHNFDRIRYMVFDEFGFSDDYDTGLRRLDDCGEETLIYSRPTPIEFK